MSSYVDESQGNWDDFLTIVASAYRSTICGSTGYTAHYALFGRVMRLPSNMWIEKFMEKKELSSYIRNLIVSLKFAWEFISEKSEGNHKLKNRQPTRQLVLKEYEVGNEVYSGAAEAAIQGFN